MNPPLQRRRLRRLGLVIVAGYFLVGWWPFDFRPANQVRWLPDRAGLQFEERGIAYNPVSLPKWGVVWPELSGFAIELWVAAEHEPNAFAPVLLSLHHPLGGGDLELRQWQQEIMLRLPAVAPPGGFIELGGQGALPAGRMRFITICCDIDGTDFYVDGQLAQHFPGSQLPPNLITGQLILGADAAGKNPWAGRCFGLALYRWRLKADEVAANYALWMQGRAVELTNSPGLWALYRFGERSGTHVADDSRYGHHLTIPEYFEPLRRERLIPPWRDLAYRQLNYSDIAVNILGFVPFGVCFFLCREVFTRREKFQHALLVVAAAAFVSLVIELIQSLLPGRVSSLTDLLMNTFGAFLGVLLAAARTRKVKTTTNGHE